MELKVQKAALKSAVSSSKKGLSRVVIQEERGHLLFQVQGNTLCISGTNNDLKARSSLAVENVSGEDFEFTADPKILEKVLIKTDLDVLRIQYDPETVTIKVYTSESGKSFASLQAFPADKMLTFKIPAEEDRKETVVDTAVMVFTLGYASSFLADIKDDQKQFDFIVIDKGIVFSANGANKMGFIVFKDFEAVREFKIRKAVVSILKSFCEGLKEESIVLVESENDIGVRNVDGSMYLSWLKSNTQTIPFPKEHIKSEGPYTRIDKDALVKVTERLIAGAPANSRSGIEITLSGEGEDAALDVALLSSLNSNENMPCARVNDPSTERISHVLDYKIFKSVLTSFKSSEEVRLHINDEGNFYKVYNKGDVNGHKYVLAAIGSYAKKIKKG